MLKKVEGIVLNETSFKETSKIINVLTKEYGEIGIIAHGAKKMTSKYRSSVNRFTYAFFEIYYKENKLSILKEIDIINPLKNIKTDLLLISYITYIVELTKQVLNNTEDSKKIFNILISTILKIENKVDPFVLTNIVETKYLEYLGVEPNLECCSVCGDNSSKLNIDFENTEIKCDRCLSDKICLNEKTIKLLKIYKTIDIEKIEKLSLDLNIKKEANTFLNMYYEKYTGLFLKSKEFLESVLKL